VKDLELNRISRRQRLTERKSGTKGTIGKRGKIKSPSLSAEEGRVDKDVDRRKRGKHFSSRPGENVFGDRKGVRY